MPTPPSSKAHGYDDCVIRRVILAVPIAVAIGLAGLVCLVLRLRAQRTDSYCALVSGCSRKWETITSTPVLIVMTTALACTVTIGFYLRATLPKTRGRSSSCSTASS